MNGEPGGVDLGGRAGASAPRETPTTGKWYEDYSTLISVAENAVDKSLLLTPIQVVSFFEKPWHYQELWLLWYYNAEQVDD